MNVLQIFGVIFFCLLVVGGVWMMITNKKVPPSTGGGCGTIKSIYVYVVVLISLVLLSFLNLI